MIVVREIPKRNTGTKYFTGKGIVCPNFVLNKAIIAIIPIMINFQISNEFHSVNVINKVLIMELVQCFWWVSRESSNVGIKMRQFF